MVWRLIRKIARLYALIAFGVLGLMLMSDRIAAHQANSNEQLLALFFPYGVLVGLAVSWIYMTLGGWLTLMSVCGFYLLNFWQSGVWSSNDLPMLLAGAAPLFLLASFIKSLGHRKSKKNKKR